MQSPYVKPIIAIGIIFIVIVSGLLLFLNRKAPVAPIVYEATSTEPVYKIIGTSVQGRKIESYTYGTGTTDIVFAGGMHGGYEWNSVLLAYEFMDYLHSNPKAIPSNLSITVIPAINVDGVYEVTGKEGRFAIADVSTSTKILTAGRFNADNVDLNRNFACNWKSKSTWQNKTVSAGKTAFSEPEAVAIRDLALNTKPAAFIFWHSQANAVYASECKDGVLSGTMDIMNAYAKAAGYPAVKSFDAYPVTGDSEGWLASVGIPAITVEMKTHDTIEWDKNLAGIKAVLAYYSKGI